MPETTRLFVALRPPAEIRERIVELQAVLARELPDSLRWTRGDQMHLALFFASAFPSPEIGTLEEIVAGACKPVQPFEIRLGPPEARPARGAPRVLWMPALEGIEPLSELHERIETSAGSFLPAPSGPQAANDRRTFRPHLTLARFPRKTSRQAGTSIPGVAEAELPPSWRASTLELVASRIEREGARHTSLGAFQLGD